MGAFERADFRAQAVLVAHFASEQNDGNFVRRVERGVDFDEWTSGARAFEVQQAGAHALAGPCPARNEDARACAGRFFNQRAHLRYGAGDADQFGFIAGPLLEIGHLGPELARLYGALGDQQQPVDLEGLFDIVISAAADGRDGSFYIAVARDHYHWKIGMIGLQDIEQLQAVEARPLHPYIEEYEIWTPFGDLVQSAVGIRRLPRLVAFIFENSGNQFPDIFFVVHNQNVTSHLLNCHRGYARCLLLGRFFGVITVALECDRLFSTFLQR